MTLLVEDCLPSPRYTATQRAVHLGTQIILNLCVYSSVKTLLLFAQPDSPLPDDQNQPVCKRCVLIPTVNAESHIKIKRQMLQNIPFKLNKVTQQTAIIACYDKCLLPNCLFWSIEAGIHVEWDRQMRRTSAA